MYGSNLESWSFRASNFQTKETCNQSHRTIQDHLNISNTEWHKWSFLAKKKKGGTSRIRLRLRVISDFELQSDYDIPFRTNTFRKGMTLIATSYGLNSSTFIILQGWLILILFNIIHSLPLQLNGSKYYYLILIIQFDIGGARGYCRRKWTRRHEFKSWTRLIAFHIALITLGKGLIQLFSLQRWVNSRAD